MLCSKAYFFRNILKVKNRINVKQQFPAEQRCSYSQDLENKYNETERDKILKVINDSGADELSCYKVTKGRSRKLLQYKNVNGPIQKLSDVDMIDGFSDKTSKKLFDSILEGPREKENVANPIKGQYIQPVLSDAVRSKCQSVLTVYITVNSVCWALVDRASYQVTEWRYYSIDVPENKRLQITDILDIAWKVTQCLPKADLYVMKAEATTLRAPGSDPNNPKVIAVNLQKSQLVSMIVALLNARDFYNGEDDSMKQKVYFLRPTLPYRLYGTLVGNEKVSTDQTVEILLKEASNKSTNNTHVYVEENLQNMFRNQRDLQKDMLGHCLLLALTFMDLCIYRSHEKIQKLAKQRN